ncbi:IPExxxVDY family protein [Roseivirga sp.]|uniref:IPExxxVDY family protein n=1 Tax=Roseivirga sp. TaxID=1964215 RepID=UPI003B51F1E4
MAKNKLQVSYDFDFLILALNANVKPYKLAWSINKELGLNLIMAENIEIGFNEKKSLSILNYIDSDEFRTVRLIKNRAEETEEAFNAYLLPELKNFDYFLLLENETNTFDENAFISEIKQIPFVQFTTKINAQTLKSKDNLIF